MTKSPMTKLEWKLRETRLEKARISAEEIVGAMKLTLPIDPLLVAKEEQPFLRCRGDDYRNRFDGQLEYHRDKNRFIMFFNTKYDAGLAAGRHHPRTRFSISHELGHYFLDRHRAHFLNGGRKHRSSGEFSLDVMMEREADAFASGLLLPSTLIRREVNQGDLCLAVIEHIARKSQASLVCAAIRCVQLSDYACAVVGLREGAVAWSSCSPRLIDAGMYPPAKGSPGSPSAREQLAAFAEGRAKKGRSSSFGRQWFRTFDRDNVETVHVEEHYLPVPSLSTLVAILSIPEDELEQDEEDEREEEF